MNWRTPAAAGLLALFIVAQQRLAQPGADAASFTLRAQLIAATIAAATCSLLQDPAANLLDASPTTLARRTVIRLSFAALTWTTTWSLTLALIATASGAPPLMKLTGQAIILLAVAVGVASSHGTAAGAGAVGLLMFAALVLPNRWSVLAGDDASHQRLALTGLAGLLALTWTSRDKARPHRSFSNVPTRRRQ